MAKESAGTGCEPRSSEIKMTPVIPVKEDFMDKGQRGETPMGTAKGDWTGATLRDSTVG